jgi:uncharacterized protein (TIGR03435 family)
MRVEKLSMKTRLALSVCLGLLMPFAQGQSSVAQTPAVPAWQTAAGGKMEFEAASVRKSTPDAPTKGTQFLVPLDMPSAFPKGLFSANAPLINYIGFAYKISDMSQYQALEEHLPAWAKNERFDVEARVEGNPTTDQVRLMVQSLLEERFKLATHVESLERPVYAMVLDKPGTLGPQVKPHPEGVACVENPNGLVGESSEAGRHTDFCGWNEWLVEGRIHMKFVKVSMGSIATYVTGAGIMLGGMESRAVVDETGLKGDFDMEIEFAKITEPGADAGVGGPTFIQALSKQLGLKLVKQSGAVSTFVIDHVEMPSEN